MTHTQEDETLQTLKHVILPGWPNDKESVPMLARPYYHVRDELSLEDGIILRGE